MRFFTKGYLRNICFSGLCIYVLFIAGCGSSSEDPTEVVPVTPEVPVTPPTTQPGVQAGIYDSTVVEGADDLEFVISLASASTETVSVEYTSADGTAVAGTDYSATNGVEQFAPGEAVIGDRPRFSSSGKHRASPLATTPSAFRWLNRGLSPINPR